MRFEHPIIATEQTIQFVIASTSIITKINHYFRSLHYYMKSFCNLIAFIEQRYFRLIWDTYMWKLQETHIKLTEVSPNQQDFLLFQNRSLVKHQKLWKLF